MEIASHGVFYAYDKKNEFVVFACGSGFRLKQHLFAGQAVFLCKTHAMRGTSKNTINLFRFRT